MANIRYGFKSFILKIPMYGTLFKDYCPIPTTSKAN